ncbi:hypothetical protein EDD22DRAFT_907379 [Suillus occidentalis]|nr:hypothetical protein EDD22DRAFT_907379 [Suillus occidentalis]
MSTGRQLRFKFPNPFWHTAKKFLHLPSVHSLSATLGEKKPSVSHLSTRDLLRRHYKEYIFSTPVLDIQGCDAIFQCDKRGSCHRPSPHSLHCRVIP